MPGAADTIQRAVHALESGGVAAWLRRGLLLLAVAVVAIVYMYHFRGLATSQAMDQAQIGREIARGHGWRTEFVRPRAIGQLQAHGKDVARGVWSDTYNAPLPPLVDALALLPIKSHWQLTPRELVYAGDKVIALMSIFLFLLSVIVLFFIGRRLFDERLALLACGLIIVCDTMWQYSLSGLPQMLLLFFFNITVYALVRAVESKYSGGRLGIWLAAAGIGFGLLALTHALTIWMFVPAFLFSFFFFRPRGWAAGILLTAFLLVYTPWLVRNYLVSGNPGGVAIYSVMDGAGHTEAGWMRRIDLDDESIGPAAFRDKILSNVTEQGGHMLQYLGWSIVALMFFAALLHPFKRPDAAAFRWLVLAMWAGGALGMVVFGIREEQGVAANQLHLIFVPAMTCYGLAFLLVQWNRLDVDIRLARLGFITGLFLICGTPMLIAMSVMFFTFKPLVRWPPYVPPYIAVLNMWMKPNEVTASDIPWAVAWYADRPSVWLPETIKVMTNLSDYKVLGGPVNGLYLTPVSGSQNTLHDIVKGEYRDWGAVIQRTISLDKFPLKWAMLLGLENECVFFSDHDRQKPPAP